jgi:hypothetical protein
MMRALIFTIAIVSCIVLGPNCLAQESQNKTYGFGPLNLDPNVKISDFFTFGTILISVVTIFLAVRGDKKLRQREQADKVRNAEAKMIENMLRWSKLSLSIFDDLDIIPTQKGKNEIKDMNPQDIWESWRNDVNEAVSRLCKKRLDENIEIIHSEHFDYDPFVSLFFQDVLDRLKLEEQIMIQAGIHGGFWDTINSFCNNNEISQSPELLFFLKNHVAWVNGKYALRVNNFQEAITDYLLSFMSEKDETILKKKKKYFKISSVKLPSHPESKMYKISKEKTPEIIVGTE